MAMMLGASVPVHAVIGINQGRHRVRFRGFVFECWPESTLGRPSIIHIGGVAVWLETEQDVVRVHGLAAG